MTLFISQSAVLGSYLSPTVVYAQDHGVTANGIIGTAGAVTASSTTFTDSSASFQPGDTGKTIIINGAGTSGFGLVTTITYVSATQVTLGAAASTTVSGAQYAYGTDDTTNLQSAINAADTVAGTYGKATLIIEDQVHIVAGALQTSSNYNTQLTLPTHSTSAVPVRMIEIRGRSWDMESTPVANTVGTTVQGATIVSSLGCGTRSAFNSSVGVASVIGGPATGNVSSSFTALSAIVRGVTFLWSHNPFGFGLDLGKCSQAEVTHTRFSTNEPLNSQVVPTNYGGGVIMPQTDNQAICRIDRVEAQGMNYGFVLGEHCEGGWIGAFQCFIALALPSTGTGHPAAFRVVDTEHCNYYVAGVNTSNWGNVASSPVFRLKIDCWTLENAPSGVWTTTDHVHDGSNNLLLDALFTCSTGGVGFGTITVTGGSACRLVDLNFGMGGVGVSVPSSGTATVVKAAGGLQVFRDTVMMVSGGTVTQIQVDGKTTGQTAGAFVVPTNKTYSITYSVAPTLNATAM